MGVAAETSAPRRIANLIKAAMLVILCLMGDEISLNMKGV